MLGFEGAEGAAISELAAIGECAPSENAGLRRQAGWGRGGAELCLKPRLCPTLPAGDRGCVLLPVP